MTDKTFSYIAQLYVPREGAESILLFVAPAGHIREWAGVPRKAFDYQHGFQRTLEERRIKQVADYFAEDARNVTPTSVVVGFTGSMKIETVSDELQGIVRITFSMPDFEQMELAEIAQLACAVLVKRLGTDVVEQIDRNLESAVVAVVQKEADDVVDDAAFSTEDEAMTTAHVSYLGDFYARLSGYIKGVTPWPDDGAQLRAVLYSFLKPGIIVDGQHRVFGAALADESMRLSVCAIPDADWAESVYQFVIINQKAKPIKPAFLSTIIATSLNQDEIDSVYSRLSNSNIDVERSEMMEQVNRDPRSPFAGMIDFEVQGASGFLQFPGISALANKFRNIDRDYPNLLEGGTWDSAEGEWIDHFFAFWRGVRAYFEGSDPRLWLRPTAANPHHLLMIVTLQEMQGMVLETWADGRVFRFTTVTDTEASSQRYWLDFPSSFFTDEWRKKGLQTTVGRELLRRAMTDTRRNIGRKSWGHRKLGLFQD